ncbi:MAG: DsbA family protein [Gammaproteobacteria bacterium]|nr:DsbA family protein [Gammaproteobacteria bacterium]MDH5659702.1 DsbA family protein [Gammaproteobacteria bacterium]
MKPILYYVHDPMCSWCWGFSRTLNELLTHLPQEIEVQRLLGGLAVDTDSPMPESMQEQIKRNWTQIEDTIIDVKFNFDFWENNIPRRSTYPACRAVIAARKQGEDYDVKMTKAIQRAYYQEARNPSDDCALIELAEEIGLCVYDFEKHLKSKQIQDELMQEIHLSRELYAESFPNLVLKTANNIYSINPDYNDSEIMLNTIREKLQYSEND